MLTLLWNGLFCIPFLTYSAAARRYDCPANDRNFGSRMLDSTIARGQGIATTNASTSWIELGLFQQAVRESITHTDDTAQKQKWAAYLRKSTSSIIINLSNFTADTDLPLDRLSIGTSMVYQYRLTGDRAYLPAIFALRDSIVVQPRNANGGLWYYDNIKNISAYHNLSYADGMFSYPLFAILAANHSTAPNNSFGPTAALGQLQILYDICKTTTGLLVHGYDASKSHSWADPETGASPIVWGRSLAWYSLGLVNSLETLQHSASTKQTALELQRIYVNILHAQVNASETSFQTTGHPGVWQVVDQPGADQNFIEASASCMTVYSLLKGVRLNLILDSSGRERAISVALDIYNGVLQEFITQNENETFSLNGTSSVASLSGNLDYEYYVTRPTLLNSLIGTSAFILASIEVGKLCSSSEWPTKY